MFPQHRWENVWVGQYLGHDADDLCAGIGDSYAYWDDVYIDTTQARVEIGDAPTYAASRHREIQLPTAWSDSSITRHGEPGQLQQPVEPVPLRRPTARAA